MEIKSKKKERPAIIAVMGHVNHGKTSLVNILRNIKISKKEHGSITQNIEIYEIFIKEKKYTLIDTPGHEAFHSIRSKSFQVTDIVLLVIAANEGIKQQTIEVIKKLKEIKSRVVIIISKIDILEKKIKIEEELLKYKILTMKKGGDINCIKISTNTNQGIEELKEIIDLKKKEIKLNVNYNTYASGVIMESKINKNIGICSKIIIREGSLKIGDIIMTKRKYFKIKKMIKKGGEILKLATPSIPVIISGLKEIPESGEIFHSTKEEGYAKTFIKKNYNIKNIEVKRDEEKIEELISIKNQIKKKINIIIKGETSDNIKAVIYSLKKIINENTINIIYKEIGEISKKDIDLAKITKSIIIGFNVKINKKINMYAKLKRIKIGTSKIIYKLIEYIENEINKENKKNIKRKIVKGYAVIKEIINIKNNKIAGCYIKKGTLNIKNKIRIIRGKVQIHEGYISTIKRYKFEINEIKEGLECGIYFKGFKKFKKEDNIESYSE